MLQYKQTPNDEGTIICLIFRRMKKLYFLLLCINLMPGFSFAQQIKLKALTEIDATLTEKFAVKNTICTPFFYRNSIENSMIVSDEREMTTDTFLIFPELFYPQLEISTGYSRAKKKTVKKEMVVNYRPQYIEVKYPFEREKEVGGNKIWKIKRDSCITIKLDENMNMGRNPKDLEIDLCYLNLDKSCPKLTWKNLSSRIFKIQNDGKSYFLKISSHGQFGFKLDLYDSMNKSIKTPFISTQNQSFQINEYDYKLTQVDLKLGEITIEKQLIKNILPHLSRKALEEKINFVLSKENKKSFVFDKKYILLHFWGPWCGPCIEDFPRMEKMINELSLKEKITIVGVSAFTSKGDRKKFNKLSEEGQIDKQQIIEHIFSDKNDFGFSNLHQVYKIESYPSLLLIDGKGNIIIQGSKFDESLASSLEEILK